MRESDTIARLGGDEFTILLKGVKSPEDVAIAAQKVLDIIGRPIHLEGKNITLTCSIGISLYPTDGSDTESLIKKADFAMYQAKGQGKNGYQLFNASADAGADEQISMERKLRDAIEHNELRIHFQPQVSIATGQIIGTEALIRWAHPKLGLIEPSEFVPLAEETGLIVPIGEWILRSACEENKRLQDEGYSAIPVAINLSARQFREISLIESVAEILAESGLSPEYLTIEITESNAMHDLAYTVSILEVLKEMGLRIALDDFGTGYSSLSYLKRLPIDFIKIDQSFIREVPQNVDDAAIITAITALAKSLGLITIAEGVETKEQLEFLRAQNCDFAQGFYFNEPLPRAELVARLDLQRQVASQKMDSLTLVGA